MKAIGFGFIQILLGLILVFISRTDIQFIPGIMFIINGINLIILVNRLP